MKPIIVMFVLVLAGCAALGDGRTPTDAQLQSVHVGMTRAETLALLGKPYETMRFPRTGTESLDYQYFDPWGYLTLYSVIVGPDGTVVGKTSRRLNDGGDHGSK
jgi:hypothetical protein